MSFARTGLFALAAVLATAAAVIGASSQPAGKAPAKPAKKSYVIGLVAKSNSNPVFIAARTGANDAAKEIGKQYGIEIKIDWRTPVSEDGQKQAEFIEQLVAAGADGIAVSASDAAKLKTAIDAADAKGVPVATFDSDVPGSKRFAYYGTDDFACGQQVAAELAKAMGGKGTVAILAGNPNAPNLQSRVRGVKDGLAKFADIKVLDTYYHPETPQDAVSKVEQVMAANPQITGWAMVGGWPLFTKNGLDKVAGKAKVVAVDALPAQLEYLRNGQCEVLLGQKVYEWGYESVRLIMDRLIKGESPKDPVIKAELVPVTKANADEYGKNWDKWLGNSGKK
ncbi:MAG: substrate-binding domain-containing protein [Phycisphaeraceae bacterium]|nr:substrate-binding domain-containing protein [Phycisphaeraceae bacterium]